MDKPKYRPHRMASPVFVLGMLAINVFSQSISERSKYSFPMSEFLMGKRLNVKQNQKQTRQCNRYEISVWLCRGKSMLRIAGSTIGRARKDISGRNSVVCAALRRYRYFG